MRRRAHEPEAAGGPQLVEQVGRHSAARFDLARSVEDRRRQLADGVEHRLDGHRVVGDRHRRSSQGRSIGASAAWRARSSSSHPPLQ